jgi:hypothetical protein
VGRKVVFVAMVFSRACASLGLGIGGDRASTEMNSV